MALFQDTSSCTLQTEVTQGPYYVNGELIRQNLTDGQDGVPLVLEIQIIDTSTCEPVPALFMDIWNCNSTGVYSGVIANGNGNSNDTGNLNTTFLRGIQQTDASGVVQFETIFPGHYTGRATHIHLLTHNQNSTTIRLNDTLLDANNSGPVHASHVGQLFFDQSLISEVEALEPYASNSQALTLSSEDMILASEGNATDPFVQYLLLGDSVQDGILAWISVGIDMTQSQEVTGATTYYETGGMANADKSMGGGPGGMADGSGGPPDGLNGSSQIGAMSPSGSSML
ncbi:uncharacterized protein AB675_8848 [Cyphellophora attinorum]|uniref:Intradiol ring-cleavage dioxygenases domain-containing protein n=1 Tax=Cyphellophora attinorum TaxID=1664694 RepID=A0A0N1NYT1_9EURO|nr:uncharacterized protein AB675_8848 [Phialophora attinorum]KPI36225.1 hypothetical protein AB675_8848 [Phialophora attinorum]